MTLHGINNMSAVATPHTCNNVAAFVIARCFLHLIEAQSCKADKCFQQLGLTAGIKKWGGKGKE